MHGIITWSFLIGFVFIVVAEDTNEEFILQDVYFIGIVDEVLIGESLNTRFYI